MKNVAAIVRRLISVFLILVASVIFIFPASALELDESTRTVPLDNEGNTTVVSLKELIQGKRLFNAICSQCHAGGITKTDFNVGLGTQDLMAATPPRNTIEGLVDYLKNPTTYDGKTEIDDLHPSEKSADIFPEMRNLTDYDFKAIAGYILTQPKMDNKWGNS